MTISPSNQIPRPNRSGSVTSIRSAREVEQVDASESHENAPTPVSSSVASAVHAGIQRTTLKLATSTQVDAHIHANVSIIEESIPATNVSLQALETLIDTLKSPELSASSTTPAEVTTHIENTSSHGQKTLRALRLIVHSEPNLIQHTRLDPHAESVDTIRHTTSQPLPTPHSYEKLSKAVEEDAHGTVTEHVASVAKVVAAGITSKISSTAALHGGEHIAVDPLSEAALSGIEFLVSGSLIVAEGIKLHEVRKQLRHLNHELTAALAASTPPSVVENKTMRERLENLSGSVRKLFKKSPTKAEDSTPVSLHVDPKIAILEKKIRETKAELSESTVAVASACLMTGASGSHFGIELTEVVAREAISTGMTIASVSLGMGMGVIGLGLGCKKLHDGLKTHNQLSNLLKTTSNAAEKTKIEEKITDAKVGIVRSSITIAASAIGITSSGLAIAATVTGVALGSAIAATGFGALALGAAAMLIGVGYCLYKNREAIKKFLSNLVTGIHLAVAGNVVAIQLRSAIEKTFSQASRLMQTTRDAQAVSRGGARAGAATTSELEKDIARMRALEAYVQRNSLMTGHTRARSATI